MCSNWWCYWVEERNLTLQVFLLDSEWMPIKLTGFSISYQKGICWLLYLCAAYGFFLSILVYHIASWSSSTCGIRICFSGHSLFHIYLLICQLDEQYKCCILVISSLILFLETTVFPSCDFCLNVSSKGPVGWSLSKKACLLSYIFSCGLDSPYPFDTTASRYMCRSNFLTEQDARVSTTSVGSMIFEAPLGKSSKYWYSISIHCMRAVVSMAPFGTHRKAVLIFAVMFLL